MPTENLILTVPVELDGKRLDQVLARLCPQHSRSRLQEWIRSGYVLVDEHSRRQRDAVKAGQNIHVTAEYALQAQAEKEDINLNIVYEDEQIIIINKPVGLVVHPGAGNPAHTLLNALLFHSEQLQDVARAGIVQRLDKDTSGLMVIAKTPSTHTYLVEQLQQRLVKRQYEAIVQGLMTAGGSVDAPVGRHHIQRKRMAVTAAGKSAVTHYRILKKFSAHTHVQLKLESGRTHQIRVHMAHIRHPIVGDSVYGGRMRIPKNSSEKLRQVLTGFPRQALHASELGLRHPQSGEELVFSAAPPADFQELLGTLNDEDQG